MPKKERHSRIKERVPTALAPTGVPVSATSVSAFSSSHHSASLFLPSPSFSLSCRISSSCGIGGDYDDEPRRGSEIERDGERAREREEEAETAGKRERLVFSSAESPRRRAYLSLFSNPRAKNREKECAYIFK